MEATSLDKKAVEDIRVVVNQHQTDVEIATVTRLRRIIFI